MTCGEPGVFRDLVSIDTTIAHAARIYDYLLGGETNFKVDREAAEYATADMPGGLGLARPTSGQAVTSSAAPCGGWPLMRGSAFPRHRHRHPHDEQRP